MMFDGLMSRWTTPRRDAWTRAWAICERDVDGLAGLERAGRLDPLAEGHALDVLEGDVMERAVLADAEDAGDVLVVELGGRSAFLVESLDDLGVDGLVGREQLEGDLPVELGVQGAEDRPHAAGADGLLQQERADHLARAGAAASSAGRAAWAPASRRAELPEPAEHGRRADRDRAARPRTRLRVGVERAGSSRERRDSGINIDSCSMVWGSSPGKTSVPRSRSRFRSEVSRLETGACNPKDYQLTIGRMSARCQRQLAGSGNVRCESPHGARTVIRRARLATRLARRCRPIRRAACVEVVKDRQTHLSRPVLTTDTREVTVGAILVPFGMRRGFGAGSREPQEVAYVGPDTDRSLPGRAIGRRGRLLGRDAGRPGGRWSSRWRTAAC